MENKDPVALHINTIAADVLRLYINSHCIDKPIPEYSGFSTKRVEFPSEGTHSTKVNTYAQPFWPSFSGLWKICIVSTAIFEQKWGKCCVLTSMFHKNLVKCIVSIRPPFLPLCSISRQQAVLSIPIRNPNPTENRPRTHPGWSPFTATWDKINLRGHLYNFI